MHTKTTKDKAIEGEVLHIGDRELTVFGSTGPMVRDIDLATWLEYKEPRAIRKLIARIWPANQRPNVRDTVERTSMPHGGEREVVVNEYWLTEAQALFVSAKSETDKANALLQEVIATFLAARSVLTQKSTITSASSDDLRRAIRAEMAAEFRTHASRHAELLRLAEQCASSFAEQVGASPGVVRSACLEIARGAVGYGGAGRDLGMMSMAQFKGARALLKSLPALVRVLPKRRRRAIVKALGAGHVNPLQLPLSVDFDMGNAHFTITARERAVASNDTALVRAGGAL